LATWPSARAPTTIKVDDLSVAVEGHDQTPNAILVAAEIDPATNYLVKVHIRNQESYKDEGDTEIKVHEGETFISVYVGPTRVS
jgi:hypothetical protein